ncbi:MAG TPA: hypothetical protein EYP90_11155 [Chromatiaceae bacterium]|nr:hypothetical protein [Chromatiaceae bacterium]
MNTVGTSSGTVLLINRHGQGIYQSVPIDNNELAKKLAPYLIHNSKHIAWPHADDSRYLGKPLEPVNEKDIKQELQPEQFFTKELLDKIQSTGRINIHIENTKVSIENFPVQLIKKIISSDDIEKSTSYSILTDKKIKSSREKHAIKSIIDNWFRPTCRDGTLKILALDSDLCSVEIPYKRNELEKYLKKLESP